MSKMEIRTGDLLMSTRDCSEAMGYRIKQARAIIVSLLLHHDSKTERFRLDAELMNNALWACDELLARGEDASEAFWKFFRAEP